MPSQSNPLKFPSVENATEEGMIAMGGDLSSDRLMLAYRSGIFPWYNEGEPIIWYSPDPRMVLFPKQLQISRSMQRILKKETFTVTYNQHFEEVITNCKTIDREGQSGTWITDDMLKAYIKLHKIGVAKSVEVWKDKELVGGIYGIDLGTVFCGESMFSKVSNASKVAFISLVQQLEKDNYKLLDCQVYNDHLASLGAEEISREAFLEYLSIP